MCIKRHHNVIQKISECVSRLMTRVYTRRIMCTQEDSCLHKKNRQYQYSYRSSECVSEWYECVSKDIRMCIKRHENMFQD